MLGKQRAGIFRAVSSGPPVDEHLGPKPSGNVESSRGPGAQEVGCDNSLGNRARSEGEKKKETKEDSLVAGRSRPRSLGCPRRDVRFGRCVVSLEWHQTRRRWQPFARVPLAACLTPGGVGRTKKEGDSALVRMEIQRAGSGRQ